MQDTIAVLVVEDDASVRDVLDMVFAQEPGIYYTIAAGGANGIAKLADGPPDVILTDLLMPRVSGVEVIQYARQRYPGIPIIAFSAKPMNGLDSDEQLIGGEPVTFLPKPFDLTDLLERISILASDRTWRAASRAT
jgi:two-component system nitrogen regulation response regulator GlnG